MFKNVLVGVDGRPGGRDAIALASRLADPNGKLTLVHVHSSDLRPSHAITPALVAEERQRAHKLLEEERAAAGIEAELISAVSMSPGRGLHERAEEQHADLIVVGSCSHGAFGRAMLGDDTRAALNGAPCAAPSHRSATPSIPPGSPRSASPTTSLQRARLRSQQPVRLPSPMGQRSRRWKS
jgi:nucleotide-binding universal stress UspA family protein